MEKGKMTLVFLGVLLLLCFVASHAWAQPFGLRKAADLNTPIPGGTGNFVDFLSMDFSGGNVVFWGLDSSHQYGIYLFDGSTLSKVVDLNTPIPEGSGNFTGLSYPAISCGTVAFWGSGLSEEGVYLFYGTTLSKLADRNTPIPDGSGNFTYFTSPVISGSYVAFQGRDSSMQQVGIYLFNGASLSKVADFNTPVPGGSGNFTGFNYIGISGGNVVFFGWDSSSQYGIYLFNGASLSKVADLNTLIPGGSGNFTYLAAPPVISGSSVAFSAQLGIYLFSGTTLSKVADLNTLIPGGSGNFDSFYTPTINANNIAFEGYGLSNQEGIYLFNGIALNKVADRNTPIPDGSGNFISVYYPVISDSNVAFWAEGSGIYLFKDNTLTKVADLNTPIPDGSGNFTGVGSPLISGNNVAFMGSGSDQRGIYLASPEPQYIHVGQDGLCGSKNLCFTSIQDGIDSAEPFASIEITEETYYEDVIFDGPKVVTLHGGWDTNFTSNSSYTTINGSITISNGTVIIKNITVTGAPNCTSTVTATVTNPARGSITSTNPVTTSCGSPVSFYGTLASCYTGATVTEGTYHPPSTSISWLWDGITAPATGFKNVSITFTNSSTPPPNGWIFLNNPIGSFYGYNRDLGCLDFPASGGTAYAFLIDPLSVGRTGRPTVSVQDRLQKTSCTSITLSILDANGNKTGQTIPMSVMGNGSYRSVYPKDFVYEGQRLLLELTPAASMDMLIYWW